MSKKLLVLGSGNAQLNLIKASKELGYYTIVCDMRPNMEGSKIADKYYEENYMDKNKIYDIACKENIDGVISNSEPAMINVSYLVDKLGLPGNNTKSVEKLLSKMNFRSLQKEAGVYSPSSYTSRNVQDILDCSKSLSYPIIIKPSECSGSRGTTRIKEYNEELIKNVFNICTEFSRNREVTVEEFVEMKSLDVFEADIFVNNNEIIWDGLFTTKRSAKMPLVPMTYVLPVLGEENDIKHLKNDIEKIIRASGVTLGEFNIEAYITKKHQIFIIEINARQGGNNIPYLIKMHTGMDMTKCLVSLSVGDPSYYNEQKKLKKENNFIILHTVFPDKSGIYDGLYISQELKKYIINVKEVVKKGETVIKNSNAGDVLAFVYMKFDCGKTQCLVADNIEDYVYPVIKRN